MSWKHLLREGVRSLPSPATTEHSALERNLARMHLNEAALGPDAEDMAVLLREFGRLELNRYPDANGKALREQLAIRWGVEPDEILLGNGSVETIGILMTAFGGPRDASPAKLIYPDPTYGQYAIMAHGYGLTPIAVPLGAHFELDEGRVDAAIDRERPSLAFFASPNSPTGNLFPAATLARLALRMNGVFVVDEAYADFAGSSMIDRVRATPGLFVMRSLSKIGLAGLRVGALIGEREAIAELDKVRIPYNVNAVSLALASTMLRHPEALDARIAALVQLRAALERELARVEDVTVFPSVTNFVLIRTPYDAHAVFERLLARGVLVRVFPHVARLTGCLRISTGTPLENARCVRALRAAVAELGQQHGLRQSGQV
jgi:histidinol-phosphate aminotransferase